MVVTDNLRHKARVLGLALIAPVLLGLGAFGASAQAASTPASGTSSTAAPSAAAVLQAIVQDDFEMGGQVAATVAAADLPTTFNLNVDGVALPVVVNGDTLVQVGPYAADPTFLLAAVNVKVWFHLDSNGDAVADLIVAQPTTIKGALVGEQSLNAQDPTKGQVLTVSVAQADGSTQQATVAVLPDTTVKILPPWDASQGLGAAVQVAAVGVMNAQGTLVAAIVVGVVSQG